MSGILVRLTYYVVIAFLIGTVAQLVTGYNKRRFFTTTFLGFIGVWLGNWIATYFHWRTLLPQFFGISIEYSILFSIAFILIW
ncbi:MAG TPA: hypothetical protein VGB30_01195, partial [bacterium]